MSCQQDYFLIQIHQSCYLSNKKKIANAAFCAGCLFPSQLNKPVLFQISANSTKKSPDSTAQSNFSGHSGRARAWYTATLCRRAPWAAAAGRRRSNSRFSMYETAKVRDWNVILNMWYSELLFTASSCGSASIFKCSRVSISSHIFCLSLKETAKRYHNCHTTPFKSLFKEPFFSLEINLISLQIEVEIRKVRW